MKLAITDACIFIELDQLRLTSAFFKLNIEVHTSVDVFHELYSQQQEVLKAYETVGKLCLHTLTSDDRAKLHTGSYNSGLSENDRTVLLLAEQLAAMVLSTDGLVRKYAEKKALECHGMFWIFDELVGLGLINKAEAFSVTHCRYEWCVKSDRHCNGQYGQKLRCRDPKAAGRETSRGGKK